MGVVNFAAVVLVYILMWFLAAGRILRAEDREAAIGLYKTALGKAGPIVGVYALYAFGARFSHVVGVVTWVIEGVRYYA